MEHQPASMRAPAAPSHAPARPSSTDRDLIRRIATRDEEAFRSLVQRYGPVALGLAKRILRQSTLAEEATQEAFLAIWQRPDSYDPSRGSVRTWLMGVVHHRSVDSTRREQTQRNLALAHVDPLPEGDIADQAAASVDSLHERAVVRAALAALPEGQRHVIELMYFAGLTQAHVATKLGIPLGTTKSRCLGGMKKMRIELARSSVAESAWDSISPDGVGAM